MLFKRIHRTALRGSQGVLTGSTGMLTLQSAQNGSQSLSGALQSRSRHLRRSQDHRWPSLASCARMESRSSNMGHTGTQEPLRGILQPVRCQHTTERSGAAQEPYRALLRTFDRTSTFGQSLISGVQTDRVLRRRICQDQPIPAPSGRPERFLTASECQHTPKRSERRTGHVMSLDNHLTIKCLQSMARTDIFIVCRGIRHMASCQNH